MWKWIGRILSVLIAVSIGMSAFSFYRAGYYTMPALKDGEYPISFKNSFRGIVVNPIVSKPHAMKDLVYLRRLTNASPERKYVGVPYEVPSWFEDAWSYCEKPAEGETEALLNSMPEDMRRNFTGARLDAICIIESDENRILRGAVFSVPRL